MKIPRTIKIIKFEIAERKKRIIEKLGEFARVRTYEAKGFYQTYLKVCREENTSEPLSLFLEEKQLKRIDEFLEENKKNKKLTSNQETHNLERTVESVKNLNSVVDNVLFSKRHHFHSFNDRSYKMSSPPRNYALIKTQRDFFDSKADNTPANNKSKKLFDNKTSNIHEKKDSENYSQEIANVQKDKGHKGKKVGNSIEERIVKSECEGIFPKYIRKGKKIGDISRIPGDGGFTGRYEKSIEKESKCMSPIFGTENKRPEFFVESPKLSDIISTNVYEKSLEPTNPVERLESPSRLSPGVEMKQRISRLRSKIDNDIERLSELRKKEEKVGKPMCIQHIQEHSEHEYNPIADKYNKYQTKWGRKTISKLAEMYRKESFKTTLHKNNYSSNYSLPHTMRGISNLPSLSDASSQTIDFAHIRQMRFKIGIPKASSPNVLQRINSYSPSLINHQSTQYTHLDKFIYGGRTLSQYTTHQK